MIDDEKLKDYVIPENYNHGFTLWNRPVQNLIEAVVMTFLVFRIIIEIPFLIKIKICVLIFFCLLTFVGFLVGIKGESVGTFAVGYVKYLITRKVYVFRTPEKTYQMMQEKRNKSKQEENYISYYERAKKKVKEKFN